MTNASGTSRPCRGGVLVMLAFAVAIAATQLISAPCAFGCELCGSVQPTLSQEIKGAELAVIARLVALPERAETKDGELSVATPMAKFQIQEVLQGAAAIVGTKVIVAPFFDDKPVGGEYLVLGTLSPDVSWNPPYALSPRSRMYVAEIVKLPPSGADRLAYFQNYLEDKEDLLRKDSGYEFALAPYTVLQALKDRMPHEQLVNWVQDPTVVDHRRLYLTMLGVCGGPGDLAMLESLLQSDDPKFKTALDATVACYLTLKHADGLPLIEKLFLAKKQEEFSDIYSVVNALRFLGQEEHGPIPRDRLIGSMRLVLDHPRLADQAIMDLARWKDWSVMDRLVALFNSNDPDTTAWVRIPVINYLRACPLPRAKQYIEELRKIDPKAVQQSETLYAVGPDSTPNVTTQRADSATAANTAANDRWGTTNTDPSNSGAAPAQSSDSPGRTLANSGWIVALAVVIGAIVLAAVARGGQRARSRNAASIGNSGRDRRDASKN